jgi:hypothetical protein
VCGADRHTTRGDITAELQTRTIWTSTGVYGLKALSLPILRPDWAQAISQLSEWLADGTIMTAIQMWEGLESAQRPSWLSWQERALARPSSASRRIPADL